MNANLEQALRTILDYVNEHRGYANMDEVNDAAEIVETYLNLLPTV
jgi:hypothetical protein